MTNIRTTIEYVYLFEYLCPCATRRSLYVGFLVSQFLISKTRRQLRIFAFLGIDDLGTILQVLRATGLSIYFCMAGANSGMFYGRPKAEDSL